MPYNFTLTALIPATPQVVYDTWLDGVGHSRMTGGEAEMSDALGGAFTAWDGYIAGKNLELTPNTRIVQSWRTTQFTEQDADSVISVTLAAAEGGTLLTLEHRSVPDSHTGYEQGGWEHNYFTPMREYFSTLEAE